jgi:hypothetical protein
MIYLAIFEYNKLINEAKDLNKSEKISNLFKKLNEVEDSGINDINF